ncbi:hypothetical protein GCM10007922_09220 [Shewanella decolorationis]|nr:hypothetical protein GCM10007922_09220 [Shewanella decolorationis]
MVRADCLGYNPRRVGQTVAALARAGRKVRASQSGVPGNAWAVRTDDKCNREETAIIASAKVVRVKGCGKSAPCG